ncbi:hypothetical protein DFH08DRAFT_811582 [Mycena albidolilacea]|uniref:Uncharacterized protein n=1 Tax=Mycena albidolilacea TaxID=1033008 RepID=A0AAD7ENV1_9AGAR|nr:hypothetical protein DFH08DRAFT_811582 [Mycena albidolilacea]
MTLSCTSWINQTFFAVSTGGGKSVLFLLLQILELEKLGVLVLAYCHETVTECQQQPLGPKGNNVANQASIHRQGLGLHPKNPRGGTQLRGAPNRGSNWIQDQRVPEGDSDEPVSVQPARELVEIPRQGTESRSSGVVEQRGVKARPEQQDGDKSTPGSSPRTKQSSQMSGGHQGVMSIKEPTGGTRGTPVATQERSRLGMDIRSEYPPT